MFARTRRRAALLLVISALAPLALTACGSDSGTSGGAATSGNQKIRKMTILVGTEPGGGFDLTARAFAKAAKDAGLAGNVQVQNVPGAGNTIALARLANQQGNGQTMQMMGLGLIGGIYANKSKKTLADTTPLGRLTQEAIIFVVPADSKACTRSTSLAAGAVRPRRARTSRSARQPTGRPWAC
jgi:putative tricarboxylic transport membrane protein